MSLVAYGSSDESEGSDAEDATTATVQPVAAVNSSGGPKMAPDSGGDISDEDEGPHQRAGDGDKNIDSLLKGLPAPRGPGQGVIDEMDELEDEVKPKAAELKDAPKPPPKKVKQPVKITIKCLPAPRGPGQGVIDEMDELEDEVKPKAAELKDAPKPPPKKVKQPVKITIPALPDSDDEDGEPAKKKPKTVAASGKSGLTALLPAPMHAAKKEANRILLPYSLGRKPKPAASVHKPAAKHTSQTGVATKLTQYDSDSDDDDMADTGGNFFSLDTPKDSSSSSSTVVGPSLKSPDSGVSDSLNVPTVPLPPGDNEAVPTVSLPPANNKAVPTVPLPPKNKSDVATVPLPPEGLRSSLKLPAPQKAQTDSVIGPDSEGEADSTAEVVYGQPSDVVMDAPLTFKGGVSSQRRFQSPTVGPVSSTSEAGEEDGGSANMYYNMPYDGTCSYPEVTDNAAFQHDQEFLRLQGKKQRGKEEINIVDVNADDYTSPGDLTKYLSEETQKPSSKKSGDQPTNTQKRKHQIQFLAFEAKERELELKNTWADNKMTKRQTQAKYGF